MAAPLPLAPIVDPQAPRRARVRTRLVLGAGVLVGAAAAAGIAHALVLLHAPPSPPPSPVVVALSLPPPLVVTIEKTVAPPPATAPADDLGCRVPAAPDLAIGRAVDPADVSDTVTTEPPRRVAVARTAPQLAILHEGGLWVSDDDGRSFARILEDHAFSDIAVAPDGVVYGLEADRIAVRSTSGAVTWRSLSFATCEPNARCDRRIATTDRELVGFIEDTVAISADRGRTWKVIRDPEFAWSDHHGALFSWRGALYQVSHYYDQCGVDDNYVFRLDADHRIAHDIFHNYPSTSAPILRASTDVATTWSWTERCWTEEDVVGRCPKAVAARRELLQAATLLPAEGGRTLAVFGGSLVEVCARGARQIYRAFPLPAIEAVDPAGRPLAWKGTTLLRWSPVHGWRVLKTFTPAVAPGAAP